MSELQPRFRFNLFFPKIFKSRFLFAKSIFHLLLHFFLSLFYFSFNSNSIFLIYPLIPLFLPPFLPLDHKPIFQIFSKFFYVIFSFHFSEHLILWYNIYNIISLILVYNNTLRTFSNLNPLKSYT